MSTQPASNRIGRGRAFTLIEMLIVVGIIGLMMTVVMPALITARDALDSLKCVNNIRQLSHAMQAYATANGACMPGGFHDVVKGKRYNWIYINGGPDMASQTIGGALAEYIAKEKDVYKCPTLFGQEEFGGQLTLYHYAMPTVLSGSPTGQATSAYFEDSSAEGNQRALKGIPVLVEPLASINTGNSAQIGRGLYDPGAQKWSPYPDGGFEGDDEIASQRHLGTKSSVGFQDGHAESIAFPEGLKASQFHVVFRREYTLPNGDRKFQKKELSMGGENSFDTWIKRGKWQDD